MEPIKAEFRYGHFYDPSSGQRILIRDGAEAVLVLNGKDKKILPDKCSWELMPEWDQKAKLQEDPAVFKARMLMPRGSKLYFHYNVTEQVGDNWIGLSIFEEESDQENIKRVRHQFELLLLEDLFLYQTEQGKAQLYSCSCQVISNPSGGILFFETLFATSLTEAYRNTCIHFFAFKRACSGNAFREFYWHPDKEKATLDQLRAEADIAKQEDDYVWKPVRT